MPLRRIKLEHYAKNVSHSDRISEFREWEMTVTDENAPPPTEANVVEYFRTQFPDRNIRPGSIRIEQIERSNTYGQVKFIENECVITFEYKRVINGTVTWEDGIMAINVNPFDQIKLSEAFQAQFPGADVRNINIFFGTSAEYVAYTESDPSEDVTEKELAKRYRTRSKRFTAMELDIPRSVPGFTAPTPEPETVELPKVAHEIVSCHDCRFFVHEERNNPDGSGRYMLGRCMIPLPPIRYEMVKWISQEKAKEGCVLGERE